MTNRILDVVILNHRLDPVETELRIYVKLEHLRPTTEIRGKLMGPRCEYASTIEIAYVPREVERSDFIELGVIIPEPSWWDPQSPFLYEGWLELWQDGASCERVSIRHGIRRIQMTSKGLRLNGKAYALRGKILEQDLTEAAAKDLRNADVNTLLANVSTDDASLWDLADRFGFFVLAMSQDIAHFQSLRNELTRHPSHFGWIFNRNDFFAGPNSETDRGMLYGVNTSAQGELPGADFLFCHERELAWLNEMNLPKIVVTPSVASAVPRSDVIGWIESAA